MNKDYTVSIKYGYDCPTELVLGKSIAFDVDAIKSFGMFLGTMLDADYLDIENVCADGGSYVHLPLNQYTKDFFNEDIE